MLVLLVAVTFHQPTNCFEIIFSSYFFNQPIAFASGQEMQSVVPSSQIGPNQEPEKTLEAETLPADASENKDVASLNEEVGENIVTIPTEAEPETAPSALSVSLDTAAATEKRPKKGGTKRRGGPQNDPPHQPPTKTAKIVPKTGTRQKEKRRKEEAGPSSDQPEGKFCADGAVNECEFTIVYIFTGDKEADAPHQPTESVSKRADKPQETKEKRAKHQDEAGPSSDVAEGKFCADGAVNDLHQQCESNIVYVFIIHPGDQDDDNLATWRQEGVKFNPIMTQLVVPLAAIVQGI
jgi:hypothetical protein